MELSPIIDALVKEFETPKPQPKDGGRMSVSRTVSLLAVLYEKARNAVEFRAEHLVRRASIERILKRRILINGGSSTVAENLVLELLWARYIDSSLIDQRKIEEIQRIIDRYLEVKHLHYDGGKQPRGVPWDTILGLAASEIEEIVVSSKKRDALTNFFYHAIRAKVNFPSQEESYNNIQTFIAAERAFAQSDEPLIAYHLIKLMYPAWFSISPEDLPAASATLLTTLEQIHVHLKDPVGEPLFRFARKQTPAFFLIRDLFLTSDEKVRSVLEDSTVLEQKLAELALQHYSETRARIGRGVIRAFIYILLTKMVFAFALEAPYDLYVVKKVRYIPIAINLLFPPVLMVVVAGFIGVPGADNTAKLVERIKKIIYHFDQIKEETDAFVPQERVRRPLLAAVFSLFYLFMFGATFFVIHAVLASLQFNIVSQGIFVFFVALVVFFGYRIRQTTRDYAIVDKQGALEPVMDFLFLPILRAGRWLSNEIAKLNLLTFFFDFILEAPLKVIFEVVEEWIRFVRVKKEEIV
ncbi:hypothetical protein HY086_02445 [Candidatus Gottesmanbacteria bacterium]|nr:hypothetical protein [Candidatus Gottesmanbacteria bacterium]